MIFSIFSQHLEAISYRNTKGWQNLEDLFFFFFFFSFFFCFANHFCIFNPRKEHFISVFFSFADQATSNKNTGTTLEYSPMLYMSQKVACVKMAIVK